LGNPEDDPNVNCLSSFAHLSQNLDPPKGPVGPAAAFYSSAGMTQGRMAIRPLFALISSVMSKKNNKKIQKIKHFWDQQAEKLGSDPLATTHDRLLRDLEVAAILKYIPKKKCKVVDIGCGNGFNTFAYAKARSSEFLGVDYSEKMISHANKALKKNKLKGKLAFQTGNVLDLHFKKSSFDIVTTGRCLINMVSLQDQKKALKEIYRILKKGGKAILCEGTQQGFGRVNEFRKLAGLPLMPYHWHNIYLDEIKLVPFMKRYFKVLSIDSFASTYYLASRLFNAVAAKNPAKPDYFSKINKVAVKLPAIGDCSPLKIFYLEK
jgi:ubiquinone/menaquinone biosynthesis C-methylase UbiE